MYLAERFILSTLVGLAFLLTWPGREGRSFPFLICIGMALSGMSPLLRHSPEVPIIVTGMIVALVIAASGSLNDGLHRGTILWVTGAIGLAIGYGRFSLAILLAIASLAILTTQRKLR